MEGLSAFMGLRDFGLKCASWSDCILLGARKAEGGLLCPPTHPYKRMLKASRWPLGMENTPRMSCAVALVPSDRPLLLCPQLSLFYRSKALPHESPVSFSLAHSHFPNFLINSHSSALVNVSHSYNFSLLFFFCILFGHILNNNNKIVARIAQKVLGYCLLRC